jgi:hypothetical protein
MRFYILMELSIYASVFWDFMRSFNQCELNRMQLWGTASISIIEILKRVKKC